MPGGKLHSRQQLVPARLEASLDQRHLGAAEGVEQERSAEFGILPGLEPGLRCEGAGESGHGVIRVARGFQCPLAEPARLAQVPSERGGPASRPQRPGEELPVAGQGGRLDRPVEEIRAPLDPAGPQHHQPLPDPSQDGHVPMPGGARDRHPPLEHLHRAIEALQVDLADTAPDQGVEALRHLLVGEPPEQLLGLGEALAGGPELAQHVLGAAEGPRRGGSRRLVAALARLIERLADPAPQPLEVTAEEAGAGELDLQLGRFRRGVLRHLFERRLEQGPSGIVSSDQLVDPCRRRDDLATDGGLVGWEQKQHLLQRAVGLVELSGVAERLGHRDQQAQPGARVVVGDQPQGRRSRGRVVHRDPPHHRRRPRHQLRVGDGEVVSQCRQRPR
ncbi:MAG: hypothetical protein EXQ70_06300 [Solirubrobacterales bacterium]|nr:hypothetical protein [Solirubrobacterales bacterium]